MNNILELRKEIDKGRLGKNIGISTGLPKLDSIIYGIQRRYLYLVGSDSGAGKSSFVIDVFLYNLIKNKENKDISILLYSFEMSTSVVYAKILSLYLWDTFNIVITYENILSLTESLSDENYFYVQKGLDWLDEIQKFVTIYDKSLSPNGIYATCKEWLRNFGEFIQLGEHKEEYIEKSDQSYKIVICDHMGLLDHGGNKKAAMDLVADYFIYFRNKCNITGIFVQQLNRGSKSVERKTKGYELLDTADLSDSSGPAQASEAIILIYYPYREKVARVENYNIQNGLQHKARVLQVVKNRFGRSDVNQVVVFHGEIGMFKELPRADEITDYSKYTELIKEETIIEEDKNTNVIDDVNENVFKF